MWNRYSLCPSRSEVKRQTPGFLGVLAMWWCNFLLIAVQIGFAHCLQGQWWYRATAVYPNAEACWDLLVLHGPEPLYSWVAFAAVLCLSQQFSYLVLIGQLFFKFHISDTACISLSSHGNIVTFPFVIISLFLLFVIGIFFLILVLIIIIQIGIFILFFWCIKCFGCKPSIRMSCVDVGARF